MSSCEWSSEQEEIANDVDEEDVNIDEEGGNRPVGEEKSETEEDLGCLNSGSRQTGVVNGLKLDEDANQDNASGGEATNVNDNVNDNDSDTHTEHSKNEVLVEQEQRSQTKTARVSLAKIREENLVCKTAEDEEKPEDSSNTDTDSEIDDERRYTPKTLDDLGIKLSRSSHVWRALEELKARQLGFICPTMFTRNVTGSITVAERLQLERKLECHNGCVNTLNFNGSGDLLASGSDDLEVVVWDWAKGKKMFSYESGHIANVFQVRYCWFLLANYELIKNCTQQISKFQ